MLKIIKNRVALLINFEEKTRQSLLTFLQYRSPFNLTNFFHFLQILQEIYEAYYWFFKRCEEYFLCKYQPPEGVKSVGEHVNLEISIYLQRFPPQQRQLRRLIFDYLLKRECCITGCDSMQDVDLIGIGNFFMHFYSFRIIFEKKLFLTVKSKKCSN